METVSYSFSNFIGFGTRASVSFKLRVFSRSGKLLDTFNVSQDYFRLESQSHPEFADEIVKGANSLLVDLVQLLENACYADISRQLLTSLRNNVAFNSSDPVMGVGALAIWANKLNSYDFLALKDKETSQY